MSREPGDPTTALLTALFGIVGGSILTAAIAVAMWPDTTCDDVIAALRQANELNVACIADGYESLNQLMERDAWIAEVTGAAVDFIYSEDQEPQRAYDLLWCIAGQATPLVDCLSMLEGVDGPIQPTPMPPVPIYPTGPGKDL